MRTDVTCLETAVSKIAAMAKKNTGHYVCVSNVHMCIETYNNPSFRQVLKQADLVVPDGKPIVWAQKLLGGSNAKQVRGMDVTSALCQFAAKHSLSVGFYGASEKTLKQMLQALKQQLPSLSVSYAHSPPFRALDVIEKSRIIEDINTANVDFLFVGLGCPKQERWMAEHKPQLNCVMLGVGAAFDFIAGNKSHAPKWMQACGLEWLFRLLSEPKRLWRRYLSTNPKFILLFCWQLLGRNFQ